MAKTRKDLLQEHIDSIGLDNIREMFKKLDGVGPTNEEFFGYDPLKTRAKQAKDKGSLEKDKDGSAR